MTLGQLIEQSGNRRVMFEVNHSDYKQFSDVDCIWSDSPILKQYYDNRIESLTAIALRTFRFTLIKE